MNVTLAIAGSRGRVALVAVEAITSGADPRPIKQVVAAGRLRATASPEEIVEAAITAAERIHARPMNLDDDWPRLVVEYTVAGSAVFERLYEIGRDPKDARLPRKPTGLTTFQGVRDPRVIPVTPNRLAGHLFAEWKADRVEVPSDLPALRANLDAFVPRVTQSGSIALGNEDMSDYDDLTVGLMFAVIGSGKRSYGALRHEARDQRLWPSREMAMARLGGSEGLL